MECYNATKLPESAATVSACTYITRSFLPSLLVVKGYTVALKATGSAAAHFQRRL